jgi:hypothetical protein
MFDKKEIANRLKIARQALPGEVNPHEFAFSAKNVDPSQYSKFEKSGKALGDQKIMELCSRWRINAEWLLTGKGDMFMPKEGSGTTHEQPAPIPQAAPPLNAQHFSADQLFAMFMEVSGKQTGILESIQKGMARSEVQASMQSNLTRVLAGVERIAIRQDETLEEVQKVKKSISQGAGKR